jgi:hypothetical protein
MTPMRRYLVEIERDPHVERTLTALRDIRVQLARAETILLPGVAALADIPVLPGLHDAVSAVERAAEMIDLDPVARVARDLEWLIDALHGEADISGEEALVTLRRGIDVITLLTRDVEQQMAGAPAAALDGAVQMLREQVGRLLAGAIS